MDFQKTCKRQASREGSAEDYEYIGLELPWAWEPTGGPVHKKFGYLEETPSNLTLWNSVYESNSRESSKIVGSESSFSVDVIGRSGA